MKKYNSIDVLKFLMSICVIAIHTCPMAKVNNSLVLDIYSTIVSLAVPFFFVCSGFLLEKKIEVLNTKKPLDVVKNFTIKVIKLFIIWKILYLPVTLYGSIVVYKRSLPYAILSLLRSLLFTGGSYDSWQLWYLLSAIYAGLFIMAMFQLKKSYMHVFFVTVLIYFVSCLVTHASYGNDLLSKLIHATFGNGNVISGVYFIFGGVMLAKYEDYITKLNVWACVFIFACCFWGDVFTDLFVYKMVLAIVLFEIVKRIDVSNFNTFIFRRCSKIFYFIHMWIFFLYSLLIREIKPEGISTFCVVLLGCSICSGVYILISKRINIAAGTN